MGSDKRIGYALCHVIPGDESWVYSYDLKTKQQSSRGKAPHQARQVKSNVKSMIIIFFDIKGIVHKEFVPTGKTVNSRFYCDILWQLHENMKTLPPVLVRTDLAATL
jgi:hypothetical protein